MNKFGALDIILNQPRNEQHGSTKFNGTSHYLKQSVFFGNWGQNQQQNRTYMTWLKLSSTAVSSARIIWCNYDPRKSVGSFENRGVMLRHSRAADGINKLQFWVRHRATTNAYDTAVTLSNVGISLNKWFHLTITYQFDGLGTFQPGVTWYVDGRKVSHDTERATLSNVQDISSTQGWMFGAQVTNETIPIQYGNYFNGWLAEFKMFDHTFPHKPMAERIVGDHYNNGQLTHSPARHQDKSLICHFKFNSRDSFLGFETLAPEWSARAADDVAPSAGQIVLQSHVNLIGNSRDAPGSIT